MKPTIKYVNHSTGYRIENTIYLNKNLKKYPELHDRILEHELKHSNGWNLKDFQMDFFDNDMRGLKIQYYKFILKHPRTLMVLLPITRVEGYWVFDTNLIIFYSIMLTIAIILGVYL